MLAASGEHPELAPYINAESGSDVRLELVVRNEGNVPLHDLSVRANLAPGMPQIPGTTEVNRGDTWESDSDDVVDPNEPTLGRPAGRLDVGDLAVGGEVRIRWMVRLSDDPSHVGCVAGVVRAVGLNEFYNVAAVGVPDVPKGCSI